MNAARPPCIILAGGRSSRMGGGDKGLLLLDGRPMLTHVIARVAPLVSAMAINANGDASRFGHLGLPVVSDTIAGFPGPLAGILAGLAWAKEQHPHASHLLTVPCDTPLLPANLVRRLEKAMRQTGAEIAIARDEERSHPVIGLWPVFLASRLAADLADGTRAIHRWLAQFHVCEVRFSARHFHNINTRAELQEVGRQTMVTAYSQHEGT